MPSSSLVSVIVPCFNYGHLLSNTLESVLDQTYSEIEIIIINDGSTDNTEQIAKRYTNKYPNKIKYYHQENKGIIYTRNKGISLAKGKYVIQLDADDWLDKDYIKETVSVADETGADIVYTDVKIVEDDSQKRQKFDEFNLDKLKYQNYIHASSLVKKEVFSHIKYDTKLENLGFEDWDVFLGACLAGSKAQKTSKTFLYYRMHTNKKSRSDLITHQQTFEARSYIFTKYLNIYPKQMGDIKVLNKLFEKLASDNRKVKQQAKVLGQKNLNKDNEIKNLKAELEKIHASKLWKISNTPRRVKNKIGRTARK